MVAAHRKRGGRIATKPPRSSSRHRAGSSSITGPSCGVVLALGFARVNRQLGSPPGELTCPDRQRTIGALRVASPGEQPRGGVMLRRFLLLGLVAFGIDAATPVMAPAQPITGAGGVNTV